MNPNGDPGLETALLIHNLSQHGALALKSVVQIHIRAAKSFLHIPTTTEESKRLSLEFRYVTDEDLYYVLGHAADVGLKEFFQAELDRRKGVILSWIYRGMSPAHSPQILVVSVASS